MHGLGNPKRKPTQPSSEDSKKERQGLDARLYEVPGIPATPLVAPPQMTASVRRYGPLAFEEWMEKAEALDAWITELEVAELARLEEELGGLLGRAKDLESLIWSLRPEDGDARKGARGELGRLLGRIAALFYRLGR